MPRPAQWFEEFDPITADFTYVRWLGDIKGIEEQTRVWDKVIVDRRADLSEWAEILGKVHKRKIQIYAYANNAVSRIMPNSRISVTPFPLHSCLSTHTDA